MARPNEYTHHGPSLRGCPGPALESARRIVIETHERVLADRLFPKRTSAQRFDELPDLDDFLRPAAVPVIAIPLAFRRATARAMHSAHSPALHRGCTTGLPRPFW